MDQVLETDQYRYVFVSHLAEGGMGSIYLGRRVSAPGQGDGRSTEVVLKQLLPEHSADPKLIEMFLREWRVTSQLDHHNIVRTLDAVTAGDDYYIVLEYVRGGDLRAILRRAKRRQAKLSIASALFIASELLAALGYAHGKRDDDGRSLGLIHRDVSPSNILLGVDGSVKLTDFGIAKAPTQGSVMFKVKGKLGYMSPEQARGESVDARTDLFAVGVVLYEALVGERLFVGQMAQAAKVFSQSVRAPSKKRGEISAALDEVVLRALSLDPVGRFGSAHEFRAALARVAELDRLTLGEHALADDLRKACGDDSASWRNLDVPVTATLDAGGDGTGVILTDDDDDDFEEDRPVTGSRPMLPNKELKSVVHFIRRDQTPSEGEVDLPATHVARDPFAGAARGAPVAKAGTEDRLAFTRTDFAIPTPDELPKRSPPSPRSSDTLDDDDDEAGVRTRVQTAEGLQRRAAADKAPPSKPAASSSLSKPPTASSQNRASSSQSRPASSSQNRPASQSKSSASQSKPPTTAARAQFEAPVPRPSVPPPSLSDLDEPLQPEPTRVSSAEAVRPTLPAAAPAPAAVAPPTRITQLPPEPSPAAPPLARASASTSRAPASASRGGQAQSAIPTGRDFEAHSEQTLRPRSMGPASLAALERNLGGRPFAKGALAIMLILVLVALGIGLGVLLSGPSVDNMTEVPAPGVPNQHTPITTPK